MRQPAREMTEANMRYTVEGDNPKRCSVRKALKEKFKSLKNRSLIIKPSNT